MKTFHPGKAGASVYRDDFFRCFIWKLIISFCRDELYQVEFAIETNYHSKKINIFLFKFALQGLLYIGFKNKKQISIHFMTCRGYNNTMCALKSKIDLIST